MTTMMIMMMAEKNMMINDNDDRDDDGGDDDDAAADDDFRCVPKRCVSPLSEARTLPTANGRREREPGRERR